MLNDVTVDLQLLLITKGAGWPLHKHIYNYKWRCIICGKTRKELENGNG